jgi:hypothetical protein
MQTELEKNPEEHMENADRQMAAAIEALKQKWNSR